MESNGSQGANSPPLIDVGILNLGGWILKGPISRKGEGFVESIWQLSSFLKQEHLVLQSCSEDQFFAALQILELSHSHSITS